MNAYRSLLATLGHDSRVRDFENKTYASEIFARSEFSLAFSDVLENAVTYRETRAPAEATVFTKYVATLSTRTRSDSDDHALVPAALFVATLKR
jgi:hypothetical protein